MSVRDLLRGLTVLDRPLPGFDIGRAPDDPRELFGTWLRAAIDAGGVEPHVMTLATIGADGTPDVRALALRELDGDGFHFATAAGSAKVRQLATRPDAALHVYWREQGRQVRVRGRVTVADADTCLRDFLDLPAASRGAGPGTLAEDHAVYILRPLLVEFWQGGSGRRHTRLVYHRAGSGWIRVHRLS